MSVSNSARIFRLFVSSTFSDFIAEREALQKQVFPELETYCAKRGARFQAVDLRWGITEKAHREHDTMRICLEEVRRCQQVSPKPNFAVLLGDRYGWEPVPARIPQDHWRRLMKAAAVTDRGLIAANYRLDDNAVPPVYCLHQRAQDPRAFELEAQLLQALRRAARDFSPNSRLPYFASATHQEIALGALSARDEKRKPLHPEQHVHVYVRHLSGLPRNESAKDFIDWETSTGQPVPGARDRLRGLEKTLRERLPGHVHDLHTAWSRHGRNGAVNKAYLRRFCDAFLSHQKALIDAELDSLQQTDERQQREQAHQDFGTERARVFAGRKGLLAKIARYARTAPEGKAEPHSRKKRPVEPLIVLGTGGSGKSSLLARAAQESVYKAKRSGAVVLQRYIGGVPGTESLMTTLTALTADIASLYGQRDPPTPESVKALADGFQAALGHATASRPLILYLDALDQLDKADRAWRLEWLPEELPQHVRVVASARTGTRVEQSARRRYPKSLIVVPVMRHTEGREMLKKWLAETRAAWFNAGIAPSKGRQLTPQQEQAVLAAFNHTGSALWLKLAYEEAATWASWDAPRELPTTVQGLIEDLIDHRLIQPKNHPKVFTERALAYLTAGRFGLSESELGMALGTDKTVRDEFEANEKTQRKWGGEKRLPPIIWSRLYFDLQTYLGLAHIDGALVMGWFHREFGEVLKARYLSTDEQRGAIHGPLAKTFQDSANIFRRIREEPYHREITRDDHGLLESLSDATFREAYIALDRFELLRHFIRMDVKPVDFFRGLEESSSIRDFLYFANGQEFRRDFGIDVVGISRDSVEPISEDEREMAQSGYSLKGRMICASLKLDHKVGRIDQSNPTRPTAGAWQFLRRSLFANGQSKTESFFQRHYPRFLMAACLRQQDHYFPSPDYAVSTQAKWFPFPVLIRGRNKITCTFDGIDFDLQESFVLKMKADLILLETAVSSIAHDSSGAMTIPGITTFSKKPILSANDDLLRAMAFESVVLGKRLRGSFGIFRGYCLLDQWDTSSHKVKLASAWLRRQLEEDRQDFDVEYLRRLDRAQIDVFGKPIWLEDQKSVSKILVDAVVRGIDNLNPSRRAQLLLMGDFFDASFLYLLAPVVGEESFSDFMERACQGMQPDSEEEQQVRVGIAYIELLGNLIEGDIYI